MILLKDGVYRRDFEKGIVLVNPLVEPGDGDARQGRWRAWCPRAAAPWRPTAWPRGTLAMTMVTTVDVAAKGRRS